MQGEASLMRGGPIEFSIIFLQVTSYTCRAIPSFASAQDLSIPQAYRHHRRHHSISPGALHAMSLYPVLALDVGQEVARQPNLVGYLDLNLVVVA